MDEELLSMIKSIQAFNDFTVFYVSTGENIMMNIEDLLKTPGAIIFTEDLFMDALEG